MTGSVDKLLRVWSPLDPKPLGTLQEDFSITHMVRIGKTQTNDITAVYAAERVLRILSIKSQKAVFLYKDSAADITAMARINSSPDSAPIITLGFTNGMIKDYDMKSQVIIRKS
jgi:hypothetical protein